MGCCSKKLVGFLLIIAIFIGVYLAWWLKNRAPAGIIAWEETEDASRYYGPDAPDPPYTVSPEDRQLLIDLVADSNALSGAMSDFEVIATMRDLTRLTCPTVEHRSLPNDPSDILEAFARGEGAACGALSSVYCAMLIAHGYRARAIELIRDPYDVSRWKIGPEDTHVGVEVFSTDHNKWFVSDPIFNCWFHLPGSNIPLSARELQMIAVVNPPFDISETGRMPIADAGLVVVEMDRSYTMPRVDTYEIDPILMYKNVFLLYFDIYGEVPDDPVQKWTELIIARITKSTKVVWLLPEGQSRSIIYYYQQAVNWLPVVGLVLFILLLVPSGGPSRIEDEEEYEDEEFEEE